MDDDKPAEQVVGPLEGQLFGVILVLDDGEQRYYTFKPGEANARIVNQGQGKSVLALDIHGVLG